MPRHLLQSVARFARHRYRQLFIAIAIVVVVSLVAASHLSFDPDVLHLLPQDAPQVQQLQNALKHFGSIDYLLVVVRVPENAVLDPYEEFVSDLGKRLEKLPELEDIQYRVGDVEELLEEFYPKSMLFLDRASREEVTEQLSAGALKTRARELKRLLATPQSVALKRLVLLDPIGLSPAFLRHLDVSTGGLGFEWSSGYLLSRDHRMLLLLAKPKKAPQDIGFDQNLVDAVRDQVKVTRAGWSDLTGGGDLPAPQVELSGRHVIALGDSSVIWRDALTNTATSLIGVLLLFVFAFRRAGPLLFAVVPLVTGLVLTFGFSAAAFGVLSSATSGVAALLIGLGIDFIIVSYGRFVEERRRGADLETALARMSGSSGRAVVVGGVTSAATFYAFAVTKFNGLRQMGYLTGTGILLCMAAVLLLLPAMLAWREDRHRRRQSSPRLYIHSFGTDRLMGFCMRHRKPVLIAGTLITVVCVAASTRIHFEDSLAAMRPAGNPAVELRDEVARRFGAGFDQMMFVVRGQTEDDVLNLLAEAGASARRLVESGSLSSWEALSSVIPAPERQKESLEWLEGLRDRGLTAERIRSEFETDLREAGLRPEAFSHGLDLFVQAMSIHEPLSVQDVEASPTGARLLNRFLRKTDGEWEGVVYLYPPPKVWRRQPPPDAVQAARDMGPDVSLVGSNVVGSYLRHQVQKDAVMAAGLGLVLVTLLLWLDFRRLRQTLMSLVPLIVGIFWMLGAMALFGIPMNFMNIFVSTMIIGIGVDYGVHMIHRYREMKSSAPAEMNRGMMETGKAIVLAALSTIIGFGSLSMSHYPGLRSMGQVAILGALSTCLVAITLLPAYLCGKKE